VFNVLKFKIFKIRFSERSFNFFNMDCHILTDDFMFFALTVLLKV
jgi:hypothetical protein